MEAVKRPVLRWGAALAFAGAAGLGAYGFLNVPVAGCLMLALLAFVVTHATGEWNE